MKRLLPLALALSFSWGCSYRALLRTDDGQRFAPVPPSQVRFSTARTPPPGARIVGLISFAKGGDTDEAFAELATLAAEHGANLIVRVRQEQVHGAVSVSGLAVRVHALAPVGGPGLPRDRPIRRCGTPTGC